MNFAEIIYYAIVVLSAIITVVSMIFAVMILIAVRQIHAEQEEFNNGYCPDCGRKMHLFKTYEVHDKFTGNLTKQSHTWICRDCCRKVVTKTRVTDDRDYLDEITVIPAKTNVSIESEDGKHVTTRKTYL